MNLVRVSTDESTLAEIRFFESDPGVVDYWPARVRKERPTPEDLRRLAKAILRGDYTWHSEAVPEDAQL